MACKTCNNRGWFFIAMTDFRGYSTITPRIYCDCKFGKNKEEKDNK